MGKKLRWLRLDNAAKIYPAARRENWSSLFRLSMTLTEDVDKQFIGTPYSIVIEGGQLKEGISGGLTEAKLEEIVTKYQLDKIKE